MAIQVLGWDGNAFDMGSIESLAPKFVKTHVRLKLTGSYASGGDTLDFTNGGVSSSVPPQSRGIASIDATPNSPAGSVSANGGNYVMIPGTTLANWKLKIFATAGTEYSAGAYSADALTEILTAEIIWAR